MPHGDFDYPRIFKVPKLEPWPTWKRYEPGWYRTLIAGEVVEIKNMHGSSVRYSGTGDHVLVLIGGRNDEYGSGAHELAACRTIGEAKQWVDRNHGRLAAWRA